jgi:hypothetical protein
MAPIIGSGPQCYNQWLWGHLIGHSPGPAVPVRPAEPTTGADGDPPSAESQAAYTVASEQYEGRACYGSHIPVFHSADVGAWDKTPPAQ